MALLNSLDSTAAAQQLSTWLASRLPDAQDVVVTDVEIPQSAGMSMLTVLFRASWTQGGQDEQLELVARVAPGTPTIFRDPDLGREFRVLRILCDAGLAVPTPRWLEEDASVLGGTFMVMDRVHGVVPGDDPPHTKAGWVLDLPHARRGELYEHTLQFIKQLQDLDWTAHGLDFLDRPAYGPTGIEQQIAYWEDCYAWTHAGRPSPTLDAAFAWAKEHQPVEDDLVFNWGDARIGNVIFDPQELSILAVIDWEMATIASPEMELGWMIFFVRYWSEGQGVEIPEGLPTRQDVIDRYEALTGRTVLHADFYEVFAAMRLSVLMMRAGVLMIEAGVLPPESPMPLSNPPSVLLAKLLDLPAPAGESVNISGTGLRTAGPA